GGVEGGVAVAYRAAKSGSKVDAALKAERMDLDAAAALVRSLAGPEGEWPDEARLSLDIGRAMSAGQELRPLVAKIGYDPKTIALERLQIGRPDSVTMEGAGSFDRVNATGKLALSSSAASLGQIAGLIAPFAPSVAARINVLATSRGPAHAKLTLDLDKVAGQSDRAS